MGGLASREPRGHYGHQESKAKLIRNDKLLFNNACVALIIVYSHQLEIVSGPLLSGHKCNENSFLIVTNGKQGFQLEKMAALQS